MTIRKYQEDRTAIGPMGAVATVPGEFISSAIFEAVQGACRMGEAMGRAARRLRTR